METKEKATGEKGEKEKVRNEKVKEWRMLLAQQDGLDAPHSHNHTPSLLFLLPTHPLRIALALIPTLVNRWIIAAFPLPLEKAEFLRFHRRWESGFDVDVLARASAVATN
jgi:hypothetical protein